MSIMDVIIENGARPGEPAPAGGRGLAAHRRRGPARCPGGAGPEATPAAPAAADTEPAYAGLSRRRPQARAAASGSPASAAPAPTGGRSGRAAAVGRESRPNEATAAATRAPADTYHACRQTASLA